MVALPSSLSALPAVHPWAMGEFQQGGGFPQEERELCPPRDEAIG